MSVISVSYDNFQLNESPFSVNNYPMPSAPGKNTKTLGIARNHGQVRVFEKYEASTITVMGEIICSSAQALEQAIDDLKKHMRRKEGTLRCDYGDGIREWKKCTATRIGIFRERENISYTPYAIDFECQDPFARSGISDTPIDGNTITSNVETLSFAVEGTMDANPLIVLQINSFDPDDEVKNISIANNALSQTLTISQAFQAGDIISIDCENYQVFKNGSLIRAKGLFPELLAGNAVLEYQDDADDRDISITISLERKYL